MKLYAYLDNDISIGSGISYTSDQLILLMAKSSIDLNGRPAMQIGLNAPSGYQDVTSIENWDQFNHVIRKDYKFLRQQIKILVQNTGWTNLTQLEKQIAVKYFVVSKQRRDQRYTMKEQIILGLVWHKESVKARQIRFDYAAMEIWNRLTRTEARTIVNQIEADALSNKYIQFGTEGIQKGDPEGLFDYIESSVGTSYENAGLLQTRYTPVGMTLVELSVRLIDILEHGNYDNV